MPKRKETDKVTFIAEYRDGSVARFDIDPWTLRNGRWVARIIARERQEQGSLKPGEKTLTTLAGRFESILSTVSRTQMQQREFCALNFSPLKLLLSGVEVQMSFVPTLQMAALPLHLTPV